LANRAPAGAGRLAAIYALVALVAPLGPMIYRLAFAPLSGSSFTQWQTEQTR